MRVTSRKTEYRGRGDIPVDRMRAVRIARLCAAVHNKISMEHGCAGRSTTAELWLPCSKTSATRCLPRPPRMKLWNWPDA